MWLRADAITGAADAASVPLWVDSSNPALDLDEALPAIGFGYPTYQTAEVNGLPVVDFNGTDQYLTANATASAATQTLFVVLATDSVAGYQSVLGASSTSGLQLQLDSGRPYLVRQASAVILSTSTALTTGAWYVISARYNEGTDAVKIRVNGTETTGTYTGTLTASLTTIIGKRDSGEYFNGRIAEAIKYSVALTDQEVLDVEAYLEGKYGL